MMTKLLMMSVVAFFISAHNVHADVSIVVVDTNKVMHDSLAANAISKQIKEARDKYIAEVTQKEEELRSEEKKLSEQRGLLAADAYNKKSDEFKERFLKVQRELQVKSANLDHTHTAALSKVQEVLFAILEEMAKERSFDIAVSKIQTLYADEKLDITDEVLKQLNERLPVVSIKDTK